MEGYIGTILPPGMYVKALYDYEADDPTSLSFRSGEVIQVLTQLESGWWDGIKDGVRGWFPSNYCIPITEGESQRLERGYRTDGDELDLDGESEGEYDDFDFDAGFRGNVTGGGEATEDASQFWIPQTVPDGRVYWFNTMTGVSTWRFPLESPATLSDNELEAVDRTRQAPELMIGGIQTDEDSDVEGLTASRGSLLNQRGSSFSNGVSPATSLESLAIGREGSSSNLSLLQQATTPKPPMPTSFFGAPTSRTQHISQKLFNGGTNIPLTWNRIVEDMKRSIERYRQSINDDDRGDFVRRAEDISDHLRLILAAGSGTTDDHAGVPSIISSNRLLYPRYREIMARFPKLVLSSHIAAADWSSFDMRQKCLQEVDGVMNAIHGFVEVARQQRGEDIPRLFPGFIDNQQAGGAWRSNNRLSIQSTSDMSIGRQSDDESFFESSLTLDKPLLEKLQDLRQQVLLGLRSLEEQLSFNSAMIDLQGHRQLSDGVCNACGKVLSHCRPWLAILESIDLFPANAMAATAQELADFASKKQKTYNLIGELLLACQTVAAPLADEWTTNEHPPLVERLARVRSLCDQLDKNTFEVAESLRLLVENAPQVGSPGSKRGSRIASSSGSARNVQGTMLSNISQAASLSGSKTGSAGGSDKLNQFFGEMPPPSSMRDSQEIPKFMQLEYEAEVVYDLKTSTPTVRGGTLNGLVEQLTRHDRYDPVFNTTFLLTYQSFTNGNELFELLVKRWNVQPMPGLTKDELDLWAGKKQKATRFRIVNVLKGWLTEYWMETAETGSQALIQRIAKFVRDTVAKSGVAGTGPLLAALDQRMRGEDPNTRRLVANQNFDAPTPILPKKTKGLKLLDIDPLEFARQLTIIESGLYGKIRAPECLGKIWSKKELGIDGKDRAENIKALILHSNRLTNWVAEMILMQNDVKKRVAVIKHFVTVADKCLAMNNFSTLTSIISAFGTTPIHRLNRTWTQVNKSTTATLERMRKLMGSTKNFGEYREALHQSNPPCIPFFGVYLTDLTFIEDGIPPKLKNDIFINFAKRGKTADVIREIQTYQNVSYSYRAVPDIQEFIITMVEHATDVGEMYERSLQVEPREREDEKIARLLSESGFL